MTDFDNELSPRESERSRYPKGRTSRPVADRWAAWVGRHRVAILWGWIVVAITARLVAPSWEKVAYDGDFDYLPAELTSVAGGKLLDDAFPGDRSRSQIVLVLARANAELSKNDQLVGLDLLRRLYHRLGEVSWQRAIAAGYPGGPIEDAAASSNALPPPEVGAPAEAQPGPEAQPGTEAQTPPQWERWLKLAMQAFDQSIELDTRFYEQLGERVPDVAATLDEPRMAIAYWDRAKLGEALELDSEKTAADFEAALVLVPDLPNRVTPILDRDLKAWTNLLDLLAWEDPIVGKRMTTPSARLAVLQLSSELAATENIATIEAVDELIQRVLDYSSRFTQPGLKLLKTGSAAIGGETLIAARSAIRYTELFTVLMILIILTVVYRSPLLIAVPMVSIGLAVVVSTAVVTLLTQASAERALLGLDLRVFTTSRIFVVVILFGAGTDYCLFLISRLKEEVSQHAWGEACERSLSGVTGALMGSALTTIIGLGMLWIAEFGKFHYTGPIIALCLSIGLLVCMSFTPALLCVLGPRVFWPTKMDSPSSFGSLGQLGSARPVQGVASGLWPHIALAITRRPATLLVAGIAVLAVPAWHGWSHESDVTYDLSSELGRDAESRRGLSLLDEHFKIGEINPVTVLLLTEQPVGRENLETESKELANSLYSLSSVVGVRTADDPLGDFPPDREMGLLSSDAWKRRALRNHRIAQQYFYSGSPAFADRLVRFDVIVDGDPFSLSTAVEVERIEQLLRQKLQTMEPGWNDAALLMTGTTPSIMDLRAVTLSDNRRIKVAVVAAVFMVLLVVIRRFGLCLYLILTVLLSYYATLGLSIAWFQWMYGDDFVGLDWKLPLFLFVILVAVGQDYNVYLVARILEEQRKLGWIAALRKAVARTGGIITACGLVMAATFFSMTSSAWFPQIAAAWGFTSGENQQTLRGITELGFALGLGVLIDTFYVRTILVPSFVAVLGHWTSRRGHASR